MKRASRSTSIKSYKYQPAYLEAVNLKEEGKMREEVDRFFFIESEKESGGATWEHSLFPDFCVL